VSPNLAQICGMWDRPPSPPGLPVRNAPDFRLMSAALDDLRHAIDWYVEAVPAGSLFPFQPPPSPAEVEATILETGRSEEHTSELQSLMRISSAVFCLQNK